MIYVVTGPTATGKTKYALELAEKYDGELVNCDSRQVYKGLDIVTGKDLSLTTGTFQRVEALNTFDIGYYTCVESSRKIWLYDILSADRQFSAFDYIQCASHVIEDICRRGKTPIIVGGTYFYIKSLLYKTLTHTIPANADLRTSLEYISVDILQKNVYDLSREYYKKLNESDKANPHRLIRAIEILSVDPDYMPLDEEFVWDTQKSWLKDALCTIYLSMPPESTEYRKLIHARVIARIENGAIPETKSLLQRYSPDAPGLRTIGYRQLIEHVTGEMAIDDVIDAWVTNEVQYAKRQMTFCKRDPHIVKVSLS